MPRLASLLATAAAAVLLCLPVAWNGQPLLYPDTPTYLRGAEMGAAKLLGGRVQPWLAPAAAAGGAPAAGAESPPPRQGAAKPITSVEDKVVLAGRSVYYGALLFAAHAAGSLWWAVLAQALCAAWLLQLLMVRLWGLRPARMVATAGVLALLSPLGPYTGLLMPDVFAGLGVLAAGTLAVYWARLRRTDRVLLAVLLLFSLAGHASHVAAAALLLAGGLAARWLLPRGRALSLAGLGVLALAVGGAMAGEWVFKEAVTRTVGAPPLRLPHLTGRLIDMGPGTAFLRQHCVAGSRAPYAACQFLANYPTRWDAFLFSTDPGTGAFALADAAGKRRMADEQMRFALDVARFDPAGVARGVGSEVLRQFGEFAVDIYALGPLQLSMFAGRVPPALYQGMQASRAAGTDAYNRWYTAATYLTTAGALALLLVGWRSRAARAGSDAVWPPFHAFTAWCIAGVAANAVVCGALASSMDRFQARVVWILPLLALAALALALRRGAAAAGAPPATSTTPPTPLQGTAP